MNYEIEILSQDTIEENLSTETPCAEGRDDEMDRFALDADGFAIISASGFAIISASGFAII